MSLSALLLGLSGASGAAAQEATEEPAVVEATIEVQAERDERGEARMLRRINRLRREAGAPPLERHPGLDAAALVHSEDMAVFAELVHVSARTGDPGSRVAAADVQAERIAENIAQGQSTRNALVSILESDPHRAQLVSGEFTHIGLASVRGESGVYVTQVLGVIAPPPAPVLPPPAVAEVAPRPETLAVVPPVESAVASAVPEAPAAEVSVQVQTPDVSAEPVEPVPAAPEAPALAPRPEAPVTRGPQTAPATTEGVPSMRMPRTRRRVAGYWVRQGGRWWYFPVPAGVQPGQILQPDANIQGPPPGVQVRHAAPQPAVQRRQIQVRPAPGVRPAWQSPRRPAPATQQMYWY